MTWLITILTSKVVTKYTSVTIQQRNISGYVSEEMIEIIALLVASARHFIPVIVAFPSFKSMVTSCV